LFRPPAVRLPTDCPSPFRPSTIRQSTDCLSPFHTPTTCLSVHPSVYPLLFFSTSTVCPSTIRHRFNPRCLSIRRLPVCLSICLPALVFFRQLSDIVSTTSCHSVSLSSLVFPPTVNHRFNRRLSVYSPTVHTISTAGCTSIPDTPSVCLSVCLPVLSSFTADCQSSFRPPAVSLSTDCPAPFRPSTVRQSTDCLSPFHLPTTCLSVHPSVYPLSFFSTSTDCPSPFRPPAASQSPPDRPSVCLSVYLPSLVFFRQLSVIVSTASCPSVYRLSIAISTVDCPSIHQQSVAVSSLRLPALSCFSANCLSSFRPPAVRLSTDCPSPFRPSTVRQSTDCPSPFQAQAQEVAADAHIRSMVTIIRRTKFG